MTLDIANFYQTLQENNINFFTGVPDSLLKSFCAYLQDHERNHIIAANEGGAIALGMGYHLATGKMPLVYLQNSGLGNTINPLLSLADKEIYNIPMLLMIGWRGQPGVKDEPQHIKQGRVMVEMLHAMEIPYLFLAKDDTTAAQQLKEAAQTTGPLAILVEKNTFVSYALQNPMPEAANFTREDAIEAIVSSLIGNEAIIATTGMASRELFEIRLKLNQPHQADFLTIGGMGHASQIALGVALNQPERPVICLDGDGALLMHMGAMAIIGQTQCENFTHIVLNNHAHDSVGGQPTAANGIDLVKIAKAIGYSNAFSLSDLNDIKACLGQKGPTLIEIKVKKGARKDLGRPTTTPLENKNKLMDFLQCK